MGNSSHLVLQNHSRMQCLVTSNKIFSLALQKGDGITGVDYLKKERIALEGVGIFSFLIVILNDFSVICNL